MSQNAAPFESPPASEHTYEQTTKRSHLLLNAAVQPYAWPGMLRTSQLALALSPQPHRNSNTKAEGHAQ